MVLNHVFKFNIPIGRMLVAFAFIFLGIKILLGGNMACKQKEDKQSTVFSEKKEVYNKDTKMYSVVFGQSTIDLTNINLSESKTIELNTVFGEMRVLINPTLNCELNTNVAFGHITTPYGEVNGMGQNSFRPTVFNKDLPTLTINAKVVFGQIKVSAKGF